MGRKNKRITKIIISLVLVITMLFSVLNIFNVIAKENDVILTNVVITDISDGSEATITSFDSTKVTTNMTFHKLNDSISYKLTIENNTDNDKRIIDIKDDNENDNIVFEYDKHIDEVIEAYDEKEIDVTAIYKNETDENVTIDKDIKFTFVFEEDEVVPTPMTGDNLYLYITLLILSIIGLVITHVTSKKVKKLMILLLVLTPIITKALTTEYVLTFTGGIKVQDKQTVKYVVDDKEESKVVPYNSKLEKPADPEKEGYNFIGWYKGDELYSFDNNVVEDLTLEAKFEAINVTYKVIHKQMNLEDDEYTIKDTDTLEGKYDAPIVPSVKTYSGFTSPEVQFVKLGLNTEITYLYKRNSYKVTYKYDGKIPSGAKELPEEKTYKYETMVDLAPIGTAPGYSFSGWSMTDDPFKVPANDLVITGTFTALGNTPYTVEHYFETLTDGVYEIDDSLTEHHTGETDTEVTGNIQNVTGFTYDQENANNVRTGNINGTGDLVLKLYYKRNKYNLSYSYLNGTPDGATQLPGSKQYKYDQDVEVISSASAPGYEFSGWSRTGTFKMPSEDVLITGSFTARNDTPYRVEIYVENIDDNDFSIDNNKSYNTQGTTDTTASKEATAYTGLVFDENNTNNILSGNINGYGTLVLKLYYKRVLYDVIYHYDNTPTGASVLPTTKQYKYETSVELADDASAPGYNFDGWNESDPFVVDGQKDIYGSFTAKSDTPYTVEHYFETLTDDVYVINDSLTDVLPGTTDTVVNASSKTVTGFTFDENNASNVKTGNVNGYGTLVLKLYYKRDKYNVSYRYTNDPAPSDATPLPQVKQYKYEEPVTVTAAATATGYEFEGWSRTGIFIMPAQAVEITGTFTPNTYQVKFDKNDNLATGDMANQQMTYDQKVNLNPSAFTKVGFHFDKWTTNNNGTGDEYADEAEVKNLATTGIITLYANYAPNTNTPYRVEHYTENENGTYEVSGTKYELLNANIDNLTGTTNDNVTIVPRTFASHEFVSSISDSLNQTISPDGTLVVKLYYNIKTYTVTFNANTGKFYDSEENEEDTQTITKRHGELLTLSELPTKPDVNKRHSSLSGWYTESTDGNKIESAIEITDNETYYAQWVDAPIMCVKATELHEEECLHRTNGCHKNGYEYGSPIIYGNTSASSTPQIGDAYDCDLNNDQVYDPETERFYYIKTENDKAVLIFFSIYDGEKINTKASVPYEEATNKLPNNHHDRWYNLDNPSRFLSYSEAHNSAICDGNFKHCDYVLENTVYHYDVSGITNDDDKPFRSGLWLIDSNEIWRIQTSSLQFNRQDDTRVNAIKPVIEVPISRMDTTALDTFTITFDAGAGRIGSSSTKTVTVGRGGVIRELPTPTLTDNTFKGWYTSQTYETSVTVPIKNITANKTYYAKWAPATGYAASIGNTEYATLQEAINAVSSSGSTPTTIVLLKNVSEEIIVDNNKNIKLNLNGNTLSNTASDKNIITVDSGSIEITGGTLSSDADVAMINVNAGNLNISGGTYNATGNGEVINNIGGNVTISGTTDIALTSSSTTKPTITNNGTLTIHQGTIKSTGSNAIYNESGTFNIGANGALSYTDPTIQGATYGIVAKENYNFYDGIIKGGTAPVAKATGDTPTITTDNEHSTITNIESNAVYVTGSETDNQVLYQTLSLRYYSQVFILTFDAGTDGTPQTQTKTVDRISGEAVGVLPTEPTRENYTFDGWYTKPNGEGTKVTPETIPTVMEGVDPTSVESAYITYYAKWLSDAVPTHTVRYNANSGKFSDNSSVLIVTVDEGSNITSFPEQPTNDNSLLTFVGWYTDSSLSQEVTLPVTITEDKEYFAKWNNNSLALVNGEYCNCTTLREAFNKVTTTGNTSTEIKLLKDFEITEASQNGVVSNGKNIVLDLQGHTITDTVNGDVKIIELNDGKVEVKNGTLTSSATGSTIQLASTGELKLSTGAIVRHTNNKQAIYNDGGTVTVTDNAIVSNNVNNRAAIHNKGTLVITGGTIISNNAFAVAHETGSLTIGTKDGTVDSTSPIIQGKTYGVTAVEGYNFYDGTIKGSTYPVGIATQSGYNTNSVKDENKTKITDKEVSTDYVMGSENISGRTYQTLTLEKIAVQQHTVTFIAGEGATSVNPMSVNDGESLSSIPETTKPNYDFAGWYTGEHGEGERLTLETTFTSDATYYANWVETLVNPYTVTFIVGDGATPVNPQSVDPGESLQEIPTSEKEGFTLEVWYTGENGTGDKLTLQTTFDNDATYYANWVAITHTVTFIVGEGATSVNPMNVNYGESLQSIPTSEKEGFTLEGWYTGENGTGNKLALETTFTSDATYYANWVLVPAPSMICIPATSLNKEACNGTNTSKGCRADGYQSSAEITYGSLVDSDELKVGNALLCDVDGTGYNHRFYYLRTDNDNAVLIYNTNFEGNNGPGISASYEYDASHAALPTTTQWSNLPTTYDNDKAARFATREDLRVAVGAQDVEDLSAIGVFKPINFIYENTSYANASGYRSTVWLEAEGTDYYRYHKDGRNVGDGGTANAVRPVIEVPLSRIELPESTDVTLTFDAQTGTSVNSVDLAEGEKLSQIPVSTRDGYSLDGWYTETNGEGTRLDLNTTFSDDTTYYANWVTNKEVVNHDTVPVAMRTYFNSISSWASGQTDSSHADYDTAMTNNLNANNCVYFTGDNRDTEYNTTYCDQPNKYDTTVNETLKIYKYNSTNKVVGEEATYVSSYKGKIYNMIPNETYYWKSTENSSNYGFVKATGERRIISIDNVQMDNNTKASGTLRKMRNVRDLGGIPVTYINSNNETVNGYIKYGKLFRGERIWSEGNSNQYLSKLGVDNEMDLRANSEVSSTLDVNLTNNITASSTLKTFEIIHYGIDYGVTPDSTHDYQKSRDALTKVMQEFVDAHNNGDDDYSLFFHCRIGADRTGTLAYLIEGILGASEEERYRDYELTVFFGLRERTRFYLNKNDNYVKFQHLKQAVRDAGDGVHEDVVAWYLKGSTNVTSDSELINDFRSILVESN